jgi:hypothetical protein
VSEKQYPNIFEIMGSGMAVYHLMYNGRDLLFKDFKRSEEWLKCFRKEEFISRRLLGILPNITYLVQES